MNEIAKEATINRSTFYAHYTDKNELLRTIIKTGLDDYLTRFPIKNNLFDADYIWEVLITFRNFIDEIATRCGYGFISVINQLDIYLKENLEHLIETRLLTSHYKEENPDRVLLAVGLSASIFEIARQTHAQKIDLSDKKDTLLPLIFPTN